MGEMHGEAKFWVKLQFPEHFEEVVSDLLASK